MQEYHKPVLVEEALELLRIEKDGKYIDCTLGDGGHTLEILKRGGRVLGIDVDCKSLSRAIGRIKESGNDSKFVGICGNFKDVEKIAASSGFAKVDGILFDLGYSMSQINDSNVGLSFSTDQPLDMRLDKNLGVTAADLVNTLPEKELTRMFREYGEERSAKRIAKGIVDSRGLKRITSTKELTDLIVGVVFPGRDRIHPATKVFQALRIAVNNEIENLENSLPRAARLLLPGGRMAVISFHSLEDRIVKQFVSGVQPDMVVVTKKPVTPSRLEVSSNPRSRSAKLRVFEKK